MAWEIFGKMENGADIYIREGGELGIEKDNRYLVRPTTEEYAEIISRPFFSNDKLRSANIQLEFSRRIIRDLRKELKARDDLTASMVHDRFRIINNANDLMIEITTLCKDHGWDIDNIKVNK